MDQAVSQIIEVWGAFGAVLLAVGFWGWSRQKHADNVQRDAQKQIDALQEKRLEDAKSTLPIVERNIAQNEKLVNAVTSLTDEFRRGSS